MSAGTVSLVQNSPELRRIPMAHLILEWVWKTLLSLKFYKGMKNFSPQQLRHYFMKFINEQAGLILGNGCKQCDLWNREVKHWSLLRQWRKTAPQEHKWTVHPDAHKICTPYNAYIILRSKQPGETEQPGVCVPLPIMGLQRSRSLLVWHGLASSESITLLLHDYSPIQAKQAASSHSGLLYLLSTVKVCCHLW